MGWGRRDPVRAGAARCPLEAEVNHVRADTFRRRSALGGPASHALARRNLTDTALQHLPSPSRLLPGMTLTAEIVTGKRTVIS